MYLINRKRGTRFPTYLFNHTPGLNSNENGDNNMQIIPSQLPNGTVSN